MVFQTNIRDTVNLFIINNCVRQGIGHKLSPG